MTIAIVCGVALIVAGICYFGLPTTMEKAKVGDVISFRYLQPHNDDAPRSFEKVIEKYHVSDSTKRHLNACSNYRRDELQKGAFVRSGNLLVTEDPSGDVRQYYTGRGIMARKHLFGNAIRPLVSVN